MISICISFASRVKFRGVNVSLQIVEKFAGIRTRKIFSSTLYVGKGETGAIAERDKKNNNNDNNDNKVIVGEVTEINFK